MRTTGGSSRFADADDRIEQRANAECGASEGAAGEVAGAACALARDRARRAAMDEERRAVIAFGMMSGFSISI